MSPLGNSYKHSKDNELENSCDGCAQRAHKTDPDFAMLADAWPALPAAVRAGILAMVKALG